MELVEKNMCTADKYARMLHEAYNNPAMITALPPMYQPSGGTVVIYDCRGEVGENRSLRDVRASLRCDGYRYGNTHGTKAYGTGTFKIKRACRFLYGPSAMGSKVFARYEVNLWGDETGLVLFHYVGDDEKAREVSARTPHGNSKMRSSPYVRRSPLVTKGDIVHRPTYKTLMMQSHRNVMDLEVMKREFTEDVDKHSPQRTAITQMPNQSPTSQSVSITASEPRTIDELLSDVQKMKTVLRHHERRIRLLEDELADRNLADTYY